MSSVWRQASIVSPPDQVSTAVDKRMDWLGAFLVTAGLAIIIIVFVLSDGEVAPKQWATPCACSLLL